MKNFVKYLFAIIFASATLQAQSISPNLEYGADSSKKSMKIQKALVDVKIVGSLATTTIDLTFYNELDRTLEGEFNFPLGEAQSVSRFAMEINGKLREGVVVEKTQGRATFESIVRRGVDPGLLEQTKGNVFRSRVYPLFPRQSKRIVIAYEETLSESAESSIYRLPLDFKDIADTFQITAKVYGDYQKPNAEKSQIENATFAKDGDAYAFERIYYKYLANKPFEFEIPSGDSPAIILAENIKGQNYFEIIAKPEILEREKPNPSVISIYWDASGSMIKRDIDKELTLLDSYFQKIQNCAVNLNLFDISASPAEKFDITDGDWSALKSRLQTVEYDGGSQLGAIDLSKDNANEILFFSDGMSDFGERELKLGASPIYAINSNQSAEHSYLRYISQATGGEYINLLSQDSASAQNALSAQRFSLISCTSENASEIYPSQKTPIIGAVSIAGKLNSSASKIILNYGFGSEIVKSDTLEIDMSKNAAKTGILNRIWAQKKIAELDARFEKNKAEITKTAKEYSIVTRNTSLIVLETVRDYIRYKIEPPEELKAEYERMMLPKAIDNQLVVTKIDSLVIIPQSFIDFNTWYQDSNKIYHREKFSNTSNNTNYNNSYTISVKLSGFVKDDNDEPIKNAQVVFANLRTNTNSDGKYSLEGSISIQSRNNSSVGYSITKDNYSGLSGYVNLIGNIEAKLDGKIYKRKSYTIAGIIRDANGTPIKDAKIEVVNRYDFKQTTSNSKGKYDIEIDAFKAKDISIHVKSRGYDYYHADLSESTKDYQINFDIQLVNTPTYNVKGKIVDEKGEGMPEVLVCSNLEKIKSNKKGEFEILLDSRKSDSTIDIYKRGYRKLQVNIFSSNLINGLQSPIMMTKGSVTKKDGNQYPMTDTSSRYGELRGMVFDEDNLPLHGATVRIEGTALGAQTKSDGSFVIRRIPPNKNTAIVTFVGYAKYTTEIKISVGFTTEIEVNMEIATKTTNCLAVTASNNSMIGHSGTISINPNESNPTPSSSSSSSSREAPVERVASTPQSDHLSEVSREGIASIVALNAGTFVNDGGYFIRGSNSADTRVLSDGNDAGNQFTGGFGNTGLYNSPTVSQYSSEQVQVLTGGVAVEYGNAMGGVVNSVANRDVATVDVQSRASSISGDGVDYGEMSANVDVNRSLANFNEPTLGNHASPNLSNPTPVAPENMAFPEVGEEIQNCRVKKNFADIVLNGLKEKEKLISKINSASKADFLKNYFELKKKYSGAPSFYIDASDAARNMGEKELSLKILSNLAEIQIEKQEIERVLGHRLRELGYADYAVESFSEVLKNREEEPQSYRDLAWAYCDKGEFQKAADLMYSIAKKDWDARFPEIETIALTEMNNIIQLSGGKVDISKYDSSFVKKLNFDLVVVLDWDMDNTDIDLWVTDPSGEKCYYGNRFTRSGGRISRDFTGGYGPEVFYIKNAPKGEYKIEANYFGSRSQKVTGAATLILDVYTKYGSPEQAKKTVLRRLTDQKEVIQVGKVTIN